MIEDITTDIIRQTPALCALIWIVVQFLKTMGTRDTQFLKTFSEVTMEMHEITDTMRALISVIKGSSDTTCNFHESFKAQMDRIEKHCADHKHT